MSVYKPLFSGYVLAGGKSTRIGTPKPLLKLDGETLIKRTVAVLRPFCENEIKAVTATTSQANVLHEIIPQTDCIYDAYNDRGPIAAIHAALADCQTEFAIILAVDLPFVDGGIISGLCNTAAGSTDFDALIPKQTDGRLQPLAGVYRTAGCLPVITDILENDDSASVGKFLDNVAKLEIEQMSLSDNPDSFINVNTKSEYARVNLLIANR